METNFNFKSSVCTSREQSRKLLELGLKKETADCYYWQECDQYGDPNGKWHLDILNDDTREHFEYLLNHFGICLHIEDALFIPAWSLHRLIKDLMPYCIKVNDIAWVFSMSQDYVRYDMHGSQKAYIGLQMNDDPYSAVIDCMQWLIDTGLFEEDYLKNGGIV